MGIIRFFDKLEDKFRTALSRRPVLYTFIGGIGVVLFYRGVWMVADMYSFMTGYVSLIISVIILLAIGLFVSTFIGDQIIIGGLKKEKKITEKTEAEIEEEDIDIHQIKRTLDTVSKKLEEIDKKLNS